MEKEKLKARILLFMPVVFIPLICLIFYGMGGAEDSKEPPTVNSGFNTVLPSPKLKEDDAMDKLSLYKKAETDSLSLRKLAQGDPYALTVPSGSDTFSTPTNPGAEFKNLKSGKPAGGEEKVKEQLALLQKQLSVSDKPVQTGGPAISQTQDVSGSADEQLRQMEKMMHAMQGAASEPDPEMTQLNNMLDKVLDIQNPSRTRNKLKEESLKNRGKVYPVATSAKYQGDDLLPAIPNPGDTIYSRWRDSIARIFQQPAKTNRFFDLEDAEDQTGTTNAVAAVVDEEQTLVSGATLKIRLTQDIYIKGQLIPKGTNAHAVCDLSNERLMGEIKEIQYKGNIFPVSLQIYDGDGIAGIRVPGAISRDVAKDEATNAIQTLQMASLDPNIGAQAATAGISAAKSLLSKKTKLIKVTVKSGHPILLLDTNSNE